MAHLSQISRSQREGRDHWVNQKFSTLYNLLTLSPTSKHISPSVSNLLKGSTIHPDIQARNLGLISIPPLTLPPIPKSCKCSLLDISWISSVLIGLSVYVGPVPSLLGHVIDLSLHSCSSAIHYPHTGSYISKPLWRKSKCLESLSHTELLSIPGHCQTLSIYILRPCCSIAWNTPLPPCSLFRHLNRKHSKRPLNGLNGLAMCSCNTQLLPEHTLSFFTIFDHLKSVDPHNRDIGSLAIVSWDYHCACHTGSSIWNGPSDKRGFMRGINTFPGLGHCKSAARRAPPILGFFPPFSL